ncbi:ABC transporter permease [Dyadobacter arcticus]|uniref:ABC transport system permease protein n=1 Tax=Dyadobacter arcticus TaxID=1078754 RepID=A0ABX0UIB2_9BACT|nr:ABC transporter permease [Dyadobacter arcticus]NIJ52662.1 putative ABC transport system permease protein [Dyadobacter arcticus]
MFQNYFKIAFRNLWKHKLFSLINILGLGLAMAFCFLQLMQVQSSFEKDSFHPFPDRTYRIITDATGKDGKAYALASSPLPLGEKLSVGQSVVEKSTRVVRNFGGNLNNGIKTLNVDGMYVDPAYFDIFGFKLEKGKPCIEPRTVVLSKETAERFFGNADPVGKTLVSQELGTFMVSGVFSSIKPFTTHLKSDMVVSMATFPQLNKMVQNDNWQDYNTYTFVLLTKGGQQEVLDKAIHEVARDNNKNVTFKDIKSHNYRSQRLSKISPDSEGLINNPYVEPLWKIGVSMLVPLIVILLAGFNYVNLTLTRSLSRGREVGVRKVAGAKRWQLVLQFLTETVVIAFFALGVGYLGLLFIKSFVHVGWLNFEVQQTELLWVSFVIFTLLTGIMAGMLPARILSSYEPAQILKGDLGPAGLGRISFRKSLVVIQFVVALVFMTFTGISNSQFDYMATDNENFNRKDIVNIPVPARDFKLLANEMGKQADVERVGLASATLNEGAGKAKISNIGSKGQRLAAQDTYIYAVDGNFIENMQLKFVAGGNLPEASADTSVHFAVINERAAKVLGFDNPKDLVGQAIKLNETEVQIAGVISNFCFMRYELPVAPLVFAYDPGEIKVLSLKITEGADKEHVTSSLNKIWKKFHPRESFVHFWYEEQLYEDYAEGGDQRFTGIIVFIVFVIAAMGLLGMVSYTTEKRTKEVGVRKVMGASVVQIISLLSSGFIKLILIASAIAFPLGYFLGGLFLNIFTYQVPLSPAVFLRCLSSLLLVGLGTIGVQAYRTAMTNPADTLRSE